MGDMKKISLIAISLIILFGGILMAQADTKFTLSSATIKEGALISDEQIYSGYGCTGENVAPDLTWKNPPKGTKSYTLIMHDPDAPMPGGWWHWIVTNIPSSKTSFKKGEVVAPPAMLTLTSFGNSGYGGPCPPKGHGKHRYNFVIYALDVASVPSKPDFSPTQIEELIKPHILGKASLTGLYGRE